MVHDPGAGRRTTPSANGQSPANGQHTLVGYSSQGNDHGNGHTHSWSQQQQVQSSLSAAAAVPPPRAAVDNSSSAGHMRTVSSSSGSGHPEGQPQQQQGCRGHHGPQDGLPDPLEPSEAEYHAAVREALQVRQ
jgi:hypothetical protein